MRRRLGWAVAAAYTAAAIVPSPGLRARRLHAALPGGIQLHLNTAAALLALMLFTATLQVPLAGSVMLLRRPRALLTGLAAHLVAPLLTVPLAAYALRWSGDADHGKTMLTALILIAAIPIATGATVWIGNGRGDQNAMVGLVVASNLISPITALAMVTVLSLLVHLGGPAPAGVGKAFAINAVVAPCLGGIAGRAVLPAAVTTAVLRLAQPGALIGSLFLTYLNASSALGPFLTHPRIELLAAAAILAGAVCGLSFAVGRTAAAALRLEPATTATVTLACGMTNSSAGAVLVSTTAPGRPSLLLPVLAYSLIQKLAANRAMRLAADC